MNVSYIIGNAHESLYMIAFRDVRENKRKVSYGSSGIYALSFSSFTFFLHSNAAVRFRA